MKLLNKLPLLLLIIATVLLAASCSSSKKGQCGCPNKQGMVGYK
ncbi:MAG TPA: hypothetical protein PK987_01895 [Ferruginibacter sp.]|nr:hypothetical protein [Ferruginibacter sp.]